MRRRNHFTLVELLVSIAIMAILAGLLIPALGKARSKARQTSCLGNLRQLGTGMTMYVDHYRYYPQIGATVPGVALNEFAATWKSQIGMHIGFPSGGTLDEQKKFMQGNVFKCPEWSLAGIVNTTAKEDIAANAAYGGGYGYAFCPPYLGYIAKGVCNKFGVCTPDMMKYTSPSMVKSPSKTIGIGESSDRCSANGTEAACLCGNNSRDYIDGRHDGNTTMDVSWLDGHVSAMKNQQIWDGQPGSEPANLYYFSFERK